jgi:Ca-activated chloride channel homolog
MLRRRFTGVFARSLFMLALTQTAVTGCQSKSSPPAVSTDEVAAKTADQGNGTTAAGTDPGDVVANGSGGTAMSLEEGRMGKVSRPEEQYKLKASKGTMARKPAIAAAQTAGVLGGSTGGGMNRARPSDPTSGEAYKDYGHSEWIDTAKDHLSTFSSDVDTASYTIARRKLTDGTLPPAAAVRVEEFVNYFHYDYATATSADRPFAVSMDAAPNPFSPDKTLLRVGVATKAKSISERKTMHLVFLVDVSGSMQSPDKLDLAKRSLRTLVDNLKENDTVALVTYAGNTSVVLPATSADHRTQIIDAIEQLTAGGSTAMGSGIELAYAEAAKGLGRSVESRVIILSDGDANVGPSTHDELLKMITAKAKAGVTLSTIGFGMGNYKDETMEQLADKGNGANFYIDGLSQSKRVFETQLGSTLEVVAQDVKLQVDFDPKQVARYRLVGYENRDIADNDFRNDAVDAGEIGAGHQVTALYEIQLKAGATGSFATARVRHKAPKGTTATEAAFEFQPSQRAATFEAASADFRTAFAAAAFADHLRGAEDAERWKLAELAVIASAAAGTDPDRTELVALIATAQRLEASGKTAQIAQ